MTEKEKMVTKKLYDANYDETLYKERTEAKNLCYDYNQLRPSDEENQRIILKKLLGKTGENFCITAPFWCDYGYNIEIGENFYSNHNLVILDGGKVTFGDNVFIAPDCGFHTAGHQLMRLEEIKGWNTHIRSQLETMCGSELVSAGNAGGDNWK